MPFSVTGGELLQKLMKDDALTESEVAFYLRQLLLAVEYMHSKNVVHLDLKPENLFLLSPSSEDLKIIDFSFARKYNPARRLHVKYGTPEFVSPEVVCDEPVTPAADLWSVGVIAHVLLSGISPFKRDNARDTLLAARAGTWGFDEEAFGNISKDAKDFISKLMIKDPRKRMTATEALDHCFINLAHHRGLGDRIAMDRHKGYSFARKVERGMNLVRTIVKPVPLSTHLVEQPPELEFDVPMLQLPGEDMSLHINTPPNETVEMGAAGMLSIMGPLSMVSAAPSTVGSGGSSEWGKEYEDEDTWYEFSSAYQSGVDTHLLPSKDTRLGVRMAKYRRNAGGKDEKPDAKKQQSAFRPRMRPAMMERADLRDLEKEREMEQSENAADQRHLSHTRKGLWQVRRMMDSDKATEGRQREPVCQHATDPVSAERTHDDLAVTRFVTPPCPTCNELGSQCEPTNNARDPIPIVHDQNLCALWSICTEQDRNLQNISGNAQRDYHWEREDPDEINSDDVAMTCAFFYSEDNVCREVDAPPPTNDDTQPRSGFGGLPLLQRTDTLESMGSSNESAETTPSELGKNAAKIEFPDYHVLQAGETPPIQLTDLAVTRRTPSPFQQGSHSAEYPAQGPVTSAPGYGRFSDDPVTVAHLDIAQSTPGILPLVEPSASTPQDNDRGFCPIQPHTTDAHQCLPDIPSSTETPTIIQPKKMSFQEASKSPKLANLTALLMSQAGRSSIKKSNTSPDMTKQDHNSNLLIVPGDNEHSGPLDIKRRASTDELPRDRPTPRRRISFSRKSSQNSSVDEPAPRHKSDVLQFLVYMSDHERVLINKLRKRSGINQLYSTGFAFGVVFGTILALLVRVAMKYI